MSRAHVVMTKRRGPTLAVDQARAARFEAQACAVIENLLEAVPETERAGLCRALVQEAVRADAEVRGRHEAAAWAAKQARVA